MSRNNTLSSGQIAFTCAMLLSMDMSRLGSGGEILRGSSPLLGSKLAMVNDLQVIIPSEIEPKIRDF